MRELENEIGCFFDRNPDGSLHSKAFAGQSFDRTVHKADLTGIEIINRLMEQVRAVDVEELEEHRAIELIPAADGSGIAGVLFIDMRTGGYRLIQAKAVLLATGAGPTMYRYHTPSGDKTCDGLAMALRYGLLRDMEMVQFHPTGLLGGPDTRMTGTVLEEGLRGAGGYLLNGDGERFMANYDKRGERATRDVVSRGIYAEMRAGRTGPMGGVYIQMSHLGPEKVAKTFPGMVNRCKDCGFDLAGGKVEVVPTAHYLMGGVEFNVDGSTASPGLYAAGEDCGGVHGANRLGGNGVANSTVFGGIAGDSMAAYVAANGRWRDPDPRAIARGIERAEYPFRSRPAASMNCATSWRGPCGTTSACCASAPRWSAAWRPWPPTMPRCAASAWPMATAAKPDLARLAQPGKPGRYLQGHHRVGAGAREQPWRALPRGLPGTGRSARQPLHARQRAGGDLRLDMVPVSFDIVQPGQSLIDGEAGTPQA